MTTSRKAKAKPGGSLIGLWVLLCLCALGFGALTYYAGQPGAHTIPSDLRADRSSSQPAAPSSRVRVFSPTYRGGELVFREEWAAVPAGEDAKVFAVNRYLQSAKVTEPGARALSCRVERGTAWLDFSTPFGQTTGTEDEGIIVNGILKTMGQFPEVESVQLLVDGKPLETLGNLDLSQPQTVIR